MRRLILQIALAAGLCTYAPAPEAAPYAGIEAPAEQAPRTLTFKNAAVFPAGRSLHRPESGVLLADGTLVAADQVHGRAPLRPTARRAPTASLLRLATPTPRPKTPPVLRTADSAFSKVLFVPDPCGRRGIALAAHGTVLESPFVGYRTDPRRSKRQFHRIFSGLSQPDLSAYRPRCRPARQAHRLSVNTPGCGALQSS